MTIEINYYASSDVFFLLMWFNQSDPPEFCAAEMEKNCWGNAKSALTKCNKMHWRNAKNALENAKAARENAKKCRFACRSEKCTNFLTKNENLMLPKGNDA